jgi:hypothetical protein
MRDIRQRDVQLVFARRDAGNVGQGVADAFGNVLGDDQAADGFAV